jgi:phage-related protein
LAERNFLTAVANYAKNGLRRDGAGKPLEWIGGSRQDLASFPRKPKQAIGYALHLAQIGKKHPDAKPLTGFGGASVIEVVEDFDGETFRAVYTVRFAEAVYVLHCFQKKSKSGISTPKREVNQIESRLKVAVEAHKRWQSEQKRQ